MPTLNVITIYSSKIFSASSSSSVWIEVRRYGECLAAWNLEWLYLLI